MVRRGLLIIVGLCLAAGFSMYILDIEPFGESIVAGESIGDGDSAGATDMRPTPDATAPKAAFPVKEGWQLVWSDDFDGPYLDMERWTKVYRKDNFNNELQFYLPGNARVQNGFLFLTAEKENREGKAYTSAMVQTKDKYSYRYGRIEARLQVPLQEGMFPAFWLLTYQGNNEIDIMEMIGNEPSLFYGVAHYYTGGRWRKELGKMVSEDPEGFHEYALEWEPDELRWYVDDQLFFKTNRGVPSDEMYIIFTLAVGGDWPGTPPDDVDFPCDMIIDYVRYYQQQ